nr:hypothetical protein [Microbacterium hydrocarbonoxydans]
MTEDPANLAESGEWTTDKFLEMNEKLHDAGLTGTMYWNYWATHWSWLSSQGLDAPYDESGAFVAHEDSETVESVQQLGDLFQDGTFVVADSLPDGAGADSVFVTHKAGFFVQGRYTIGTVDATGEQDSYDIVPWPTPTARLRHRSRDELPRDQRQDQGEGCGLHVLDRVPLTLEGQDVDREEAPSRLRWAQPRRRAGRPRHDVVAVPARPWRRPVPDRVATLHEEARLRA